MVRPAGERHVVAIGGSSAAAASAIAGQLASSRDLAILVWCPALTLDALRGAVPDGSDVVELVDRAELASGRVYLAPRDRRLAIEGEQVAVGGVDRAPFDALLRAVADTQTTDAIGILLCGEDHDGSLGIKRVKETGGLTIVETPDGAGDDVTRAAIESGVIDLVLARDEIAPHVLGLRSLPEFPADDAEPEKPSSDNRVEALRDILTLVRVRSGHDFSPYKRATLFRRIARRMQVRDCLTLDEYHRYLRDHEGELGHLLRDFLISVTNFFRDPDSFAALASLVIPKWFATKHDQDHIRVWVAGCATGEEAYSLGILLLEHAARSRTVPPIQIFATDIDERALAEARLGCYSDAIAADVSPERLQRFFTREDDQYRVCKELREMVLFSPHNVLRDPPFSRLDLVSCRNLLIYLDRDAQQRILASVHFGLRPGGVMMLGSSESADATALFGPLDAKYRLFARRAAPASLADVIAPQTRWLPPVTLPSTYVPPDRSPSLGELHYRVVENYAPPSLLVNPELDIVHVSEHAGRFLRVAGGEPTRQVLRLVQPGLQLDLRTAIYGARQQGSERRLARFEHDGVAESVELQVQTVDLPELGRGSMLIVFAPVTDGAEAVERSPSSVEPVVREMEDELLRTRDQLRTSVEQYETSLEELKASNEELQAINEELRSATEELETSKEELQSVNEELTTLNQELNSRVDEVSHANADLQNLMTSTEIGVIFLDRALRIKRFTPRVQELFNVIPSDLDRPIEHVTHHLIEPDLVAHARSVLATLQPVERKIKSADGRSFLVRWLPYRSLVDRIEGVVITLVDVSELRDAVEARQRSETALEVAEERLRSALATAPMTVLSFDAELELSWAFIRGREYAARQFDIASIMTTEALAELRKTVARVAETREPMRIELAMRFGKDDRVFEHRVEARKSGVTAIGFDITSLDQAQRALRESDTRKDEFLATLSHELRNPLAALKIALDVARMGRVATGELHECLDVMERQMAMLSTLVDELLDLSRITHGKITLDKHELELARVLEQAVESVRPAIESAAQELHTELPVSSVRVEGDRLRLVQVFTNLLSNATKFTPDLGRIELTTTVDRARNVVEVRIADNGNGIAAGELDRIFEIFVQSRDSEGRARGGLGIGLNVVRGLVEMHGGSVGATSAGLGKGSAFTVELPLAP